MAHVTEPSLTLLLDEDIIPWLLWITQYGFAEDMSVSMTSHNSLMADNMNLFHKMVSLGSKAHAIILTQMITMQLGNRER